MATQSKLHLPSQLRLVDGVYQSLESAILSGHLPPGERLVEARIAEELSCSRTTVREALLRLERQGLVVNHPRRGTYVTRLSQEDALDLGYTRALLESFAVTVGLPQLDQFVFAVLEEQLAAMGTCSLPDDLPRLVKIDLAFHRVLVECSKSTRLMELWSSLNGQIGALFIRGIEHQHAHTADIVALHRQLVAALRSADPQIIQRTVLEHYVRLPRPDAMKQAAVLNTLQTIASNYVTAREESR